MGRVFFSALVNTIRGRVSHSVLSSWKGINVIKIHNPNPRQPRSAHQQRTRGAMNDLSGQWYSLTSTQKKLWDKYASMIDGGMSGLNAYIKINSDAYMLFGSGSQIQTPPPYPSTPKYPSPFTCTAVGSQHIECAWTEPTDQYGYVLVYQSPLVGLDDGSHPHWDFVCYSSSNLGICTITTSFPTETGIRLRAVSMDSWGRISPGNIIKSPDLIYPGW